MAAALGSNTAYGYNKACREFVPFVQHVETRRCR